MDFTKKAPESDSGAFLLCNSQNVNLFRGNYFYLNRGITPIAMRIDLTLIFKYFLLTDFDHSSVDYMQICVLTMHFIQGNDFLQHLFLQHL